MIVRGLQECIGTDRDVVGHSFNSRRLLLARDGQEYSLHDTVIAAGAALRMWYRHHVESVYCVAGEGELENLETGERFPISDGILYCLDRNERHILRATTDLRLVCVFTPALVGPEIHDEDGAFPLLTDELAPVPVLGSPEIHDEDSAFPLVTDEPEPAPALGSESTAAVVNVLEARAAADQPERVA